MFRYALRAPLNKGPSAHALGIPMWVERTLEEIAAYKRRRFKEKTVQVLVLGFVLSFILTFFYGWLQGGYERAIFVPLSEIVHRAPVALVLGLIASFICLLPYNLKDLAICVKCGEAYFSKRNFQCKCGGAVRMAKEIKWVEDA